MQEFNNLTQEQLVFERQNYQSNIKSQYNPQLENIYNQQITQGNNSNSIQSETLNKHNQITEMGKHSQQLAQSYIDLLQQSNFTAEQQAAHIHELAQRVAALSNLNLDVDNQNQQYKSQLLRLSRIAQDQSQQESVLKQQLVEQQVSNDKQVSYLVEKLKEFKQQILEEKHENIQLKAKLVETKHQIQAQKQDISQLTEIIQNLENDLDVHEEMNDKLQKSTNKLEIQSLTHQEKTQTQISSLQAENEDLRAQVTKLKNLTSSLHNRFLKAQSQATMYYESLKELKAINEKQRRKEDKTWK
ncbi:Hypothetical_protein [Hexamita inflata]|uniref:Hypothetical_protein n=1 Tax=Hexamita inflata TaxID=28002 RepID=A0AA86Q5J7_9EUKA|nr:Hypothetical protein HINF_LOCUS34192 [Hexamita inflata]